MKKSRFLALMLVAAVMLMGAGYAYWTDTLTISNSVSTGHFDVDFKCNSASATYYENYTFPTGAAGLGSGTVETLTGLMQGTGTGPSITTDGLDTGYGDVGSENNDQLTLTVTNMYPDGAYLLEGTIKNLSSIPVKFNEINYTLAGDHISNLRDYLKIKVIIAGTETTIIPLTTNTGSLTGTLTLPQSEITMQGEVDVDVLVYFDKEAPNDTTEGKTFTLNITPEFKQFNGATY